MRKYHYVYRITNTQENKHYYGVRSSKVEPKLDLGIKYFSSSTDKEFIKEQKENKYIFKYKIIKQFDSRKEANQFEIDLHWKFDVARNESFYNRAKATLVSFCIEGYKHTEETREKQSKARLGKSLSDETKAKLSKSKKGKPSSRKGKNITQEHKDNIIKAKQEISEETRKKLSLAGKGKPSPNKGSKRTEETKNKMKEKAKNREKLICPHCRKEGPKPRLLQWHFDKCKKFSCV